VCNLIAIPITLREVDVDCLIKLAIQESGFDIKLLGDETIGSDEEQEEAQGIETYHRGKHLIVILSLNLGKFVRHEWCFEFVYESVGNALNFKDRFRIYNLSVGRSVNHILSMVTPKSIHFSLDSRMP
jgi:hypothetical protein